MERRELIQWLVATSGLGALAPGELLAFGRETHRRHQTTGVLSPHDRHTVTIAAERILPTTDTPGATAANVPAFIEKMLADWYSAEERDRFLAGLHDLDARSQANVHRDFVDCAEADQLAMLHALDAEALPADEHWFGMLKYLTVYGWCTSEVGMRALGEWPLPWRYDGCAPV